ncbi:MAG: gephyrin-like molybdotransferase Glp [Verrucomicrobiota bacterium]
MMHSIDDAKEAILAAVLPTLQTQSVSLDEALGRISREKMCATVPLPGFDNSAMDGFAVSSEDASTPGRTLRVVGEQPAGPNENLTIEAGEAIRVFTGAPIPEGADAVVMQEDTKAVSDGVIEISVAAEPGEFIRRAGTDLCQGQIILEPGLRLQPAHLAVLASQGIYAVTVSALPRVAVVTTGNELVPPGAPLQPGQLYNSNAPMLSSLVRSVLGTATPVSHHHLSDDPCATTSLLAELRESCDIVLLSGGVSVGEHDHVKKSAAEAGFSGELWRVRMKPGKPLFFASASDCSLFGLPGNPVSSFVTFKIFVESALWKRCGAANPLKMSRFLSGRLAEDLENKGDRPHFVRVKIDAETGEVHPTGPQRSDALFGLSQADGLVCIDANGRLNAGTEVSVQLT